MKSKMTSAMLVAVAGLWGGLSAQQPAAAAPEAQARIEASKTGAPISKYVYGQFIEHLGRCIYGGIWAEMLEDRKFYYAVGAEESPWRVAEGGAVTMVTEGAYVGEQMARIAPHSVLVQGGLGLVAGKPYVGRIVLSGKGPVEVSLVWGADDSARQTVRVEELSQGFATYPLAFTAKAASDDGRLEIAAAGSGAVDLGTVSLMPGDNVDGMRADTLAVLRELDSPVYRWPGGNFVSGYDWRDGIGDPDKRPPRKNPAWTGVEHNDFGIDEFMVFCRELGTEPYIAVNSGLGGAENAVAELEYANGGVDTPMGALRAKNGHAEPYGVLFWGIGNEMYGDWQLGHMPLEDYVKKHNVFAEALRAKDPNIKLVGVGATGKWSETMLAHCAGHMDYLSEHFYNGESKKLQTHVRQPARTIEKKVEAHRRYHESIPALAGKSIPICMDEWNYWYGDHVYGELGTRYFLKDALGVAQGLHAYFRASDVIYMANYAQTVNVIGCIKTTKTAAAFATTGLVLKLYRKEFGTVPVAVEDTPGPWDVMAAWTEDRSALTVGVVNASTEAQRVALTVKGAALSGDGTRWVITGPDPMAYNEPGKAPVVAIQEEAVSGAGEALDVPPLSVCLYRLAVK